MSQLISVNKQKLPFVWSVESSVSVLLATDVWTQKMKKNRVVEKIVIVLNLPMIRSELNLFIINIGKVSLIFDTLAIIGKLSNGEQWLKTNTWKADTSVSAFVCLSVWWNLDRDQWKTNSFKMMSWNAGKRT